MITLDQLRERWIEERPKYKEFACSVREKIAREAHKRGIICTVTHRAKEVDSLVRKQIEKDYRDPWSQIRDKAGVRIVLMYRDTASRARTMIEESFHASEADDKARTLGSRTLGYTGIHYEVGLLAEDLTGEHETYRGLVAEVQIHTRGQALWAEVSHDLLYKPSQKAPEEIERMINCLQALLEIFDKEVEDARKYMAQLPGHEENRLLEVLRQQHYKFTARPFNSELSVLVVGHLKALFTPDEIQGYRALIEGFVAKEIEKLSRIYDKYKDDPRCSPLLFQPESLLIFERLERDRFKLKDTWDSHLPPELLQDLAVLWGKPLPG
jgi:ppGpp synthetase/RelA/SpoT-type nucleotidyltranferase